jgi:hypothetical protein
MSNTSRLYLYQTLAKDGAANRNLFVRADTSATGLALGGLGNNEAVPGSPGNIIMAVIEGRGGPKSKTAHARTVTVVMTGAVGDLGVGSRVRVPVFQRSRWNSYQVGQSGTYQGASCVCVAKTDGSPDITGRSR